MCCAQVDPKGWPDAALRDAALAHAEDGAPSCHDVPFLRVWVAEWERGWRPLATACAIRRLF
eukprot:COSAG01_NODE_4127_length_5326_cov_3.238569_7_plen_62_part_00